MRGDDNDASVSAALAMVEDVTSARFRAAGSPARLLVVAKRCVQQRPCWFYLVGLLKGKQSNSNRKYDKEEDVNGAMRTHHSNARPMHSQLIWCFFCNLSVGFVAFVKKGL